jgi:hypothetical protein
MDHTVDFLDVHLSKLSSRFMFFKKEGSANVGILTFYFWNRCIQL